jgi:hypothetical protein
MKNLIYLSFILFLSFGCTKKCFKDDACKLKGEPSDCLAYIKAYYFDKNEKKCVEFIWGGCGELPPFTSMEACINSCECID